MKQVSLVEFGVNVDEAIPTEFYCAGCGRDVLDQPGIPLICTCEFPGGIKIK